MCGEISNSNLHLVEDFSEDLSDVRATQTKRVKKMVLVYNASFVHNKSARNLAWLSKLHVWNTHTQFTVEVVRLVDADNVLVLALTQNVDLDAVFLQFTLIGDVDLLQCRLNQAISLTGLPSV